MGDQSFNYHLYNSHTDNELLVVVEPLAGEFTIPAGKKALLIVTFLGSLDMEVDFGENVVSIWLPSYSGVKVHIDGVECTPTALL